MVSSEPIGAAVQSLPLVGAEIARVRSALVSVTLELDAMRAALREVTTDGVGTSACDAAVSAGISDLRSAVGRLQTEADQCAEVAARHVGDEPEAPRP
jgi:hypothetical protein